MSRPIPPLPPCLISPSIYFSLHTRYSYLRVYFALNFGDGVKYWAIDHHRLNQTYRPVSSTWIPFSPCLFISSLSDLSKHLSTCYSPYNIELGRLAQRPPGRKQQDRTLSICLCLCLYRCWCLQPPLSFFLPFPVISPAPVPFHLLSRFHCFAPNLARCSNTTLKRHISPFRFGWENPVWIWRWSPVSSCMLMGR